MGAIIFFVLSSIIVIFVMYLVIKTAVFTAIVEAEKHLDPGSNYWKSIVKSGISDADHDKLKTAIKEAVREAIETEGNLRMLAHDKEKGMINNDYTK